MESDEMSSYYRQTALLGNGAKNGGNMRSIFRHLAAGAAVISTPALADTVCEWIDFSQAIERAAPASARTPEHDIAQTRVALAMFEAVNAIDRRYESYLNVAQGDQAASQDAAAATAAYQVLLALFPSQKGALDESYQIALEEVRDIRARDSGRMIGEKAAEAALKAGGLDPTLKPVPYLPRTTPGTWVATTMPVYDPTSITFKPWILPSITAVRPGPPPDLTSDRWARDYDEVRRLGSKASADRTAHQSLMARYRITPNMMPSYRLTADAPGRSPVQNARMFAMLNMIADDADMATAEAKFHYNFWRPITAIRNGEFDGNPATTPDPGWEPLINTPNHPEYPCAHCSYAAAIADFMTSEVGVKPPAGVRVSSRSIPNSAVQAMPSWDEWMRQVSFSRTLGGVHYRFSNEAGEEIGHAVAKIAMANIMKPLPKAPARKRR